MPFISVCIAVHNEKNYIRNVLEQLLAQNYPNDRYEIIVVDGGSTDGTSEIVKEYEKNCSNVIYLINPKKVASAGRNIGIDYSKGDIFVVIDGHCHIPSDKLFRNIVDCFISSKADCLCRPQPLDPPGISNFQKAVAIVRKSGLGHAANSLIYSDYEGYVSPVSHGAVYRKYVFKTIGNYDENFDACEDVELNFRLEKFGFSSYMSPSLEVKYYPRNDFSSLFNQIARYGYGRVKFLKKHPSAFISKPLLFFISCVFFLFMLVYQSLFWTLSFVFVFSFLLMICYSVCLSLRNNLNLLLYIIPIFFVVYLGFFWGGIKGLFSDFSELGNVSISEFLNNRS